MRVTRKQPSLQLPRWRFYFVALALFVLVIALVAHLSRLQVMPGEDRGYEFLQGQGNARTVRTEVISAHRGMISDRHGRPLAVSTPVVSLWMNPSIFNGTDADVSKLASLLELNSSALAKKLARYGEKQFIYLKRHVKPALADQVLALGFAGVGGQREYRRFYPAGEVTSHVVGFTDVDDQGQEGIELSFDEWLTGQQGAKQVLKDLKGRVVEDLSLIREAEPGKDVTLSIDLRLQYLAYKELKKAVTKHRAKSGSVVVLDVTTGEILAMVNQPAYNPNDRSTLDVAALRNRAIIDQFEPGSTMKPLTVLAALETGRYHAGTIINTSPGRIKVGRKTLLDPVNYGEMTVAKVLKKSSQVGITKIALDLEPTHLRETFFRFGVGQATGSGFPGESVGVLPSRERWQPIERATLAFGYGLTTTALQLAQTYSVLANDGVKKPISLLRVDGDVQGDQVAEVDHARDVVKMLSTVTERGGTATRASLLEYKAAGKTGTAHKVGKTGYEEDNYTALFAGMAPADNPRLVSVVIIDEPKAGGYHGGEAAAPVFGGIVGESLRILGVPPERAIEMAEMPAAVNDGALL